MTVPPLRIVYGDEPSQRTNVVAETLRGQGHEVTTYADHKAFLSAPEPDLYVLGRALEDGTRGLELLRSLRSTGRTAPAVMVDEKPGFDDLRSAIELGAADFVLRPLEEGELARAVARAQAERTPKPDLEHEPRTHACELRYAIDESTVGRAARQVSAFLVNEGVVNAHRVRIASALAEIVDNACRHAYPDRRGEIRLRAEVQRTRVQLVVEDDGRGFDVTRSRLERVPAALPGRRANTNPAGASTSSSTGLGRAERLCEGHEIVSGTHGTRVTLSFELTPVRFDEESEHLSETDFLDPARARSLVASLRKGRADLSGVPPGMALTIGRILGGLDAQVRPPSKT
jgi:anti-sigma regulatory factor (Ser/Thr protein kinase)/CheY-like chemotaxis protein